MSHGEYQIGPLFVRDMGSMSIPHQKGWKMEGHTHNFDHATFICKGKYRIKIMRPSVSMMGEPIFNVEGRQAWTLFKDIEVTGPFFMTVDKGNCHAFECLEGPGVFLCVFPNRNYDGKIVEQYLGNYAAFL